MLYMVAIVYELIGTNIFAIQLINASVGAATAIIVYYVAQSLFNNHPRVACGGDIGRVLPVADSCGRRRLLKTD